MPRRQNWQERLRQLQGKNDRGMRRDEMKLTCQACQPTSARARTPSMERVWST